MIKIAVCDDEQHFVTQIKNILVEYGKTNQIDISVSEFHDGVMLLDRYDCSYDIIFLDIKMPHIDGVKVAEKIRVRDPNVTIIFLTSLFGRAVDGYRVRASNFLVKPVSKKKLTQEIDRWIEMNREKKQECLLVENMTGRFMIPISSLRYIETADRNLLLHSDQKVIDVAYAAGFQSLSRFYHLFKQEFGVSPMQYRRGEKPVQPASSGGKYRP